MKVEGPKSSSPVQAGRAARPGRTGGGDFASHLRTGEASTASTAMGTQALTSVDALLALQGAEATPDSTDQRGRRKRAVARGKVLLDRLEEIRHGLLLGEIPVDRLRSLQDEMRVQRERFEDPRLTELIDEIELRCAVELAKLGL